MSKNMIFLFKKNYHRHLNYLQIEAGGSCGAQGSDVRKLKGFHPENCTVKSTKQWPDVAKRHQSH